MTVPMPLAPTIDQPDKKKVWTFNDYLQLSDDKRYEIIHGELFEMPSPPIIHQLIISILLRLLGNWVEEGQLGFIFTAPTDVILGSIAMPIQPDILFVSTANSEILGRQKIEGAPDLVIEVLSPSSVRHDRQTKFRVYETAGIPEYWIINPKGGTVEIYALENEQYELAGEYAKEETLISPLLGERNFVAQQLFPDTKPTK